VQRVFVLTALLAAIAACNSGTATSAPKPAPPSAPSPPPQASKPVPVPAQPPRPDVSKLSPQETYLALCAPCHAKDAKGGAADHAPSLVNPTFLESASDDFLRKSIVLGRPGTSMAAYGKAMGGPLDDAKAEELVRWLRGQGPALASLAAPGKGDAAAGEKLYVEYCRTCHGDTKTRGEAVHLANVQFQQSATDAFIRYAIDKGRPTTKMPAFGTVMTPQQLDDLVAFVRTFGGAAQAVGALPAPTGKEPLVLNPSGKDPVWKHLRNDPANSNTPRFVAADELKKALDEKRKLIIIDARPQSEWMRVHIAGAVSIEYFQPSRLAEVPKDVWAIAYCACPHHLSGIIVDELIKRGHPNALVLDEGINVWHQKGYPVVAAPGVTAPPKEPVGSAGEIR
jgi:cytochrome c oxidase cbb3-type subunit 3